MTAAHAPKKFPNPRTLFAVLITLLVTALSGTCAILVSYLDKTGRSIDWISENWSRGVAWAAGMKVEVQGLENVDPTQTYVVVSNHQSHMDTIALYCTSPVPLRMLAKASLFRIPIFGRAMARAGHIQVYRDKKTGTDFSKMLSQVEGLKKGNRSIMVFAEGTRSLDGMVAPFKKGAFAIASHFELPILPVAICGTRDILPAKQVSFKGGKVKVIYYPAISVDESNMETVREQTHATIANRVSV